MKYSLWCFLFGHNWLGKFNYRKEHGEWIWSMQSVDFCQRCGLSKEEVGITRSANN